MRKNRKGFCPPLIVVLAAAALTIFSLLYGVVYAIRADAAVIPGSEIAPPGGSTTITTTPPTTPPETTPTAQVTPEPAATPTAESTPVPTVGPLQSLPPQSTGEPQASAPIVSEPPAVAEDPVGKYPSKIDAKGIRVVSPSIDDLLAEDADIDKLLYPSGLKLPTKYMDLLMFAPVNLNSEVIDEAAYLLKTIAPVEGNTYTYAEYSAAEVYLGLCRLAVKVENTSATATAVRSLDKNTSVNWMNNITNATASNKQRILGLITTYRSILEQAGTGADVSRHAQYRDLVAEHRGVRYSCGDLRCFTDKTFDLSYQDEDLSAYVLGLYSWWDYTGVTQNLTSAILTYSTFYDEFAYNDINYNRGSPAGASSGGTSSEPSTAPDPSNTTSVQGPGDRNPTNSPTIVGGSSNDGDGSGWLNPGGITSGDGPVTSVGNTTGTDTDVLPAGKRNMKEVASIAAVIFVIVAVIALWAIRSYRKGQDPLTRRWK